MSNSFDIRIINALADFRESMLALTSKKRSQIPAGKWGNGIEIRRFDEGSLIEIYMEYEPNDGVSFCWWLEVTVLASGWKVQLSVLKDQSSGQEVLGKFPKQRGKLTDGLLDALRRDQTSLLDSVNEFQFS